MKEKLAEEYASSTYDREKDSWEWLLKREGFLAGWEAKEASISGDAESELVEEILQKFEEIGIDTSEWEYKFGDGNFAADFIKCGVQSHLDSLNSPLTMEGDEADKMNNASLPPDFIDIDRGADANRHAERKSLTKKYRRQ